MAVSVPETANLTDPVFDNARVHPDAAAFSVQTDGRWRTVTAREFAEQVVAVAKGLIAMGVDAGDRVGLMARTCYEWTLLDYAIWSAGAITVPVYETSSGEQVAWYLADSQAVAVVVETGDHATIVEAAQPSCPALRHVWRIDSDSVGTLTGAGRDVPDGAVAERRATLSGSTVATLIYTSGTTGHPKGCELTHGNFLFDIEAVAVGAPQLWSGPSSTLLFLPLAHIFARLIQCFCVTKRVRMGHTADVANLLPDLAAFQPTFILSVPRVFEKVYNTAKRKAHAVRQRQEQQGGARLAPQLRGADRDRLDVEPEVAVGEFAALGVSRRTRGVDERGHGAAGQGGPALGHRAVGDVPAGTGQRADGIRVDPPDMAQRRTAGLGGLNDGGMVAGLHDHGHGLGVGEVPGHLLPRRGLVDRHSDGAGRPDRVVQQRPLVAGASHQPDPVAGVHSHGDQSLGDRDDLLGELAGGHRAPATVGLDAEGRGVGMDAGVVEHWVGQVRRLRYGHGYWVGVLQHGHSSALRRVGRPVAVDRGPVETVARGKQGRRAAGARPRCAALGQ